MRVFFTTTPRLKVHYDENIKAIFENIEKLGYSHTSDYICKVKVDDFYKLNKDHSPIYYQQIMDSLRKADVVVFEVSIASIGVGHLLEKALELGKGVIALHMKDKSSPFLLRGIKDEKLIIEEYTLLDLPEVLKSAFDTIRETIDVRFNFFVPPRIIAYLDWIAKNKKLPRAVFLRRLIEEHMKRDKDYKS